MSCRGHSDNPRCPRKPISSSPYPTLPSSSSRRPSVSWILIRTVFSPPPTWWRPSVPMERALVVVMPRYGNVKHLNYSIVGQKEIGKHYLIDDHCQWLIEIFKYLRDETISGWQREILGTGDRHRESWGRDILAMGASPVNTRYFPFPVSDPLGTCGHMTQTLRHWLHIWPTWLTWLTKWH